MATRDYQPRRRFSRNSRHQPHNHYRHYYQYIVCLCAIIVGLPAYAEGNATSVAANPQAAITGSVANQAVQINQGSLSTQGFRQGHYCNGPVLSFTPYYLGTESTASSHSFSRNYGGQVSVSFPLDGGSVETCKALARKNLDKARLDYELVRIKECINIYKQGFTIHPSSPFFPVCADVVPVASLQRQQNGDQASAGETKLPEEVSSES